MPLDTTTDAPLASLVVTAFWGKNTFDGSCLWVRTNLVSANLSMERYSVLGPRANCYCMDKIVIEEFATISQDAELCGGSHDIDDVHDQLVTRPIHIGRQAWVAAGAFVGPGVKLGEGAVIGARGVTMKSLEPWKVYAGNPAQFIRKRKKFDRAELVDT